MIFKIERNIKEIEIESEPNAELILSLQAEISNLREMLSQQEIACSKCSSERTASDSQIKQNEKKSNSAITESKVGAEKIKDCPQNGLNPQNTKKYYILLLE